MAGIGFGLRNGGHRRLFMKAPNQAMPLFSQSFRRLCSLGAENLFCMPI
jgi:hypothetical protein